MYTDNVSINALKQLDTGINDVCTNAAAGFWKKIFLVVGFEDILAWKCCLLFLSFVPVDLAGIWCFCNNSKNCQEPLLAFLTTKQGWKGPSLLEPSVEEQKRNGPFLCTPMQNWKSSLGVAPHQYHFQARGILPSCGLSTCNRRGAVLAWLGTFLSVRCVS